mgnify:CR=1 FL=1
MRLSNNLLRDTMTVIWAVAWMLYLDWMLTLLVLVVYPLAAWPVIRIGQRLRKTSAQAQSHMGEVTSQLEESFSGTRMVKTYGLEDYEAERADKSFFERLKFLFRITENKARVDPILELVGGIAFAGLVGFAGWRLLAGETSVGNILGVLTGIGVMSPAVRAIGTLSAVVQEGFAVLDRVFHLLDEDNQVAAALEAPELTVKAGSVEVDGVSFHYADGTAALDDVSLHADAGKTIALVGPSGSGKSTILNLIPRLYDPQAGRVTIDGTDIRSVSLSSLRRHIALVSQDVTLFDDSVAANIGFGRLDADREAIIAAARAADAHDFIINLPDGYDSPVGPRGSNLSGGQRQRLSIARAILKDAPILLLDEATSALDTESEQRVQAALERLSAGRTTLVIAHRLSTVRKADWIYVLQDGRVHEQGRHDELIAQDGLYAKLCRLQFGEEQMHHRQADREHRAGPGNAFDLDIAIHQFGQFLGDRQAKAGAPILAGHGRLALAERHENPLDQRRLHADPGIADLEVHLMPAIPRLGRQATDPDLATIGELDGVGQKIGQDLADTRRVATGLALDAGIDFDMHVEPLLHRLHPVGADDTAGQLGRTIAGGLDFETPGLDMRQVEDIIENIEQGVARTLDQLHHFTLRGLQIRIHQQAGHAEHAVHGRADLMAHRRQKLGLGPAGLGGLLPGLEQVVDIGQRPDQARWLAVRAADGFGAEPEPAMGPAIHFDPYGQVERTGGLVVCGKR